MGPAAHVVEALAQAALLLVLAPLVTGYIQKLKARLQARAGASVVQPYRDLYKLLRKGTVQADSASPFFRAIPVLVLSATVAAAAMLPIVYAPRVESSSVLPLGDAILLLGLLALGRFLQAIGALDAGGAFGGMGASREMTVGLLVEPALMLVVFSVAVAAGTTDLVQIAVRRDTVAALSWQAADLLALIGIVVLVPAETGRIPVDNPDTHLELTMLHEGMLLEHSGPGLGCLALASHAKQLIVLTLAAVMFFPRGIAESPTPEALAIALGAFGGKVFVLATFLGLVESSYAKLRLFRVPQYLGLGLLCAFLALALRVL